MGIDMRYSGVYTTGQGGIKRCMYRERRIETDREERGISTQTQTQAARETDITPRQTEGQYYKEVYTRCGIKT